MSDWTDVRFYTVPWYAGLARHSRQEMPGGALKLVLFIAEVVDAMGMASGGDIAQAVVDLSGCNLITARKAFGVAMELGLIEQQPVTSHEWGIA